MYRSPHSKLFALSLLGTIALLSGCAPIGKAQKNSDGITNQCLPQKTSKMVAASSFSRNKMQVVAALKRAPASIEPSLMAMTKSQSDVLIAADQPLTVTVDNECLLSHGSQLFHWFTDAVELNPALKVQSYDVKLSSDVDAYALMEELNSDVCVLGLSDGGEVKSSLATNDTQAAFLKHLDAIQVEKGWADMLTGTLNNDVIFGVVDTGVNYNHTDLAGNIWQNAMGNRGIDLVNGDNDPNDDNGHGSHVAGIAGALANNSMGVAGVMPKNIKIMAVKTLNNNGAGSIANAANGIRWAADNGAQVINLSLGTTTQNQTLADAIVYAHSKGSVVVIAAGNDGREITTANPMFPAMSAKDLSGVISVGATSAPSRDLASFSNYSTTFVEIAAPGAVTGNTNSGVLSTIHATTAANAYGYLAGTSMATPVVGGAAAMLIAYRKNRGDQVSNSIIEELLSSAATSLTSLNGRIKGGKHLDLQNLKLISDTRDMLILNQPQAKNVLIGESVDLNVSLTNMTGLSFQWQKDDVDINGATSAQLVINSADLNDSGVYRVRITNPGGTSIFSDAVLVSVFKSSCN